MFFKLIAVLAIVVGLTACDNRSSVVSRKDVVYADNLCSEHDGVVEMSVVVYQTGRRQVTAACNDGVTASIYVDPPTAE